MSGVAIVRHLLASNAALISVVPASRIKPGVLPLNIALPAIAVSHISGQQHNNLAMASNQYLVTDRVQVTVLAKDVEGIAPYSGYQKIKEILALVRSALPLSRGTNNGFLTDAVMPDFEGPDIYDPETLLFSQSVDYRVTYHRDV